MKRESVIIVVVAISVILLITLSYALQEDEVVSGTGTITYLSLEGGFFGIVGDDGEHYDTVNLDEEFRVDGLRVQFKARISENQVSGHMWGTIVEIIEIHEL